MKSEEIRKKFIEFFEKRGHKIVPSSSLVPENDPTTLFTGSGMQPMVPYLLGGDHPAGKRVVNSQKCFRAEDIEEVGDNRHTTFFEMLGNWSFGDYFRTEQIQWISEFLFDEIKINPNKLYVTVFGGDEENNLPKDIEAVELWKAVFAKHGIEAKVVEIGTEENGAKVGMQGGRIFYYGSRKNWWSRAGTPDNMPVGEPGGPDSEMFYEFSSVEHDRKYGEHCHPNCDCGRYLEIGNNVFMTYKKVADGTFEMLPRRNIDFGGGLERIIAAVNNVSDVFKTDLFARVIDFLPNELSNIDKRVVADHMRSSIFMIADGVRPGSNKRDSVLRKLIRICNSKLKALRDHEQVILQIVELYIEQYKNQYPKVFEFKKTINEVIQKEINDVNRTESIRLNRGLMKLDLSRGLKKLDLSRVLDEMQKLHDEEPRAQNVQKGQALKYYTSEQMRHGGELTAEKAFYLHTTEGIDMETILAISRDFGLRHEEDFNEKLEVMSEKHKEISRKGSEQKFKGGLAGHSDMEVKYHTATHLLHQALHDVLGDEVMQKGSNITPERLRFDFSFPRKMTDEEKRRVEEIVNEKIGSKLPVQKIIMPKAEAEKTGARHFFGEKYPDGVSIYYIGEDVDTAYSKEFCGGPHVENIGTLGKFKIQKEEAISAGTRRIKATLE
ncbi:MAG: alanine--tRNA ligase-related protein [Candidatus Zambryskibacteria bacterium]|nr:alanine--tRNA ligase-related protein [Candidatus Zambryskibacteria bacterium]